MKGWRIAVALSFLLLSGCLVSFNAPLPTHEAAPAALLGKWSSKNAWGVPLNLTISQTGPDRYKAVSYPTGKPAEREEYPFTVARHGSRWYLSAPLPARFGGHHVLAGFELNDREELVVYTLDLEQMQQVIAHGTLRGERFDSADGEGMQVTSSAEQVFAYLDDPANSDVFVEAARYQRRPR